MDTLCDRRFNQEGIKLLGQIESLLINACNGKVNKPSDTLESLYRADIDFQLLQIQLVMLPDLIKVVNDPTSIKIMRIMTVSTICGLMNTSSFGKYMFSKVNILLRVYLTVLLLLQNGVFPHIGESRRTCALQCLVTEPHSPSYS